MAFKFLLSLSYDGTDYAGWVIQNNAKTIQSALNKAIKLITKNDNFKTLGASKTDAGVHALDQKVVLTVDFQLEHLAKFQKALNKTLPTNIWVNSITPVEENFILREQILFKEYQYVINDGDFDLNNHRYELKWNFGMIDLEKLNQIAQLFVGQHEFKLFSGLKPTEYTTFQTYRTIHSIDVVRTDHKIILTFKAPGFIRYQIRMIVGAILNNYQNKKLTTAEIQEKLQGIGAKTTTVVESCGLILKKIYLK
ncbi:tRNA pseudouridine synthase A [Williamsoniiplasma luminosum]|uniref:tRNA pseudouridine synthase A n=1 Tax=Williamsoniiplasma luminosum TaxID=214888 RepID=A0A2K8NU19_9MOLU|nr:tRNA pseudouridine(38-40) synthase TruA [Williamsoniiplasma luminosum]ATZ17036.1 tRNA pseudouridine synthase A [Williamsoniiplasma luminosum]